MMLHKVTSTYKELARLVPGLADRPPSHVRNKQTLLNMARKGIQKPPYSTKLGMLLSNYTRQNSQSYDHVFTKNTKKIAPHWFDKVAKKKTLLLDMAKKGRPKPHHKTKLGQTLGNYLKKSSQSYDPVFAKEIRRLAPSWFVTRSDFANEKKKQLIEMARKKLASPRRTTKLGKALYKYTTKESGSYDPAFDKKVRRLAPNWFVTRFDVVNHKKRLLIDMARRELPMPSRKTKIGKALYKYTLKSSESYDPVFAKEIRRLAPNWLATRYDIVNENKKLLLEMARKKQTRPNRKTKFGAALINYSCLGSVSYDPVFAKQIRKLAPHWFKRSNKPSRS
jgi:hypothetical protein